MDQASNQNPPMLPSGGAPMRELPAHPIPVPLPPGQARHHGKGFFIAFVVLLAVVLLGGGAGAAYYFDVFKPDPNTVIDEAFDKLREAQTWHAKSLIEVASEVPQGAPSSPFFLLLLPQPGAKVSLSIESDGAWDRTDSKNIKSYVAADVRVDTGTFFTGRVRGEYRHLDGKGYFTINELPSFGGLIDSSNVKDAWWFFDAAALQKAVRKDKAELLGVTPEKVPPGLSDPQQIMEAFLNTWKADRPFMVSKDNGLTPEKDRSYELVLDPAHIRPFIVSLYKTVIGMPLTDEQLTSLDTYVLPSISGATMTLGVNRKTGYLHRAKLVVPVHVNESFRSAPGNEMIPTDVLVSYDAEYTNYNEPVTVTLPAGAKPAAEFAESLQSPKYSITPPPSRPDSDNDGLFDDEEVFYKTDSNKSDTDGDGFMDGDEVRSGFDPSKKGVKLEADHPPGLGIVTP